MKKQSSYNKRASIPHLTLTLQIFQEGRTYIAYTPELDVSSCADTLEGARRNLTDAVKGFLMSAQKLRTLREILEEAGFRHNGSQWTSPRLMTLDRFSV